MKNPNKLDNPNGIQMRGNVAEFHVGRNKGMHVGVYQTARVYVEGHQSRANIVDAVALAAGYIDAIARIAELEKKHGK